MSGARSTYDEPDVRTARPSTAALVRRGAAAGALGAGATTATAAIARGAGVALDVGGAAIPTAAFAMWTIIGAALGVVLARLLADRRRFVRTCLAVTGLSLIPPIAMPDDRATTAVLLSAHLLAAAIIIPTLGRALGTAAGDRREQDR